MRGGGWFRNGDERVAFGPGDVLFVPAHRTHRFEEFTEDLAVWVFFYGPQGGEAVAIMPASREGARLGGRPGISPVARQLAPVNSQHEHGTDPYSRALPL